MHEILRKHYSQCHQKYTKCVSTMDNGPNDPNHLLIKRILELVKKQCPYKRETLPTITTRIISCETNITKF